MNAIELKIEPRRAALVAGEPNSFEVLVTVTAPPMPAATPRRGRLNLALVLDRSGSMSGLPLDEAVKCAKFVIDQLDEGDFASIVSYDDEARVLVPAQRLTSKSSFYEALASIHSGGMTALHAGWLAGAQQAAVYSKDADVSRVLLLSDGQANIGIQDLDAIASHCSRMVSTGVSTSTYGLGRDFNEQLMSGMAQSGHGNSYYGETAQDLIDPFTREFELLASLFARSVRLSIDPSPGVAVKMLNDYTRDDDGSWVLPPVPYGGQAWAILRVDAPPCSGSAELFGLLVNYSLLGDDTVHKASEHLVLRTVERTAFDGMAENVLVARRAGELNAARLQRDARSAAERGDWTAVDAILVQARAEAPGNEWVAASLDTLQEIARQRDVQRFSKEAHFKAQRMATRLTSAHEDEEYSSAREMAMPSYLRRKQAEGRKDDD